MMSISLKNIGKSKDIIKGYIYPISCRWFFSKPPGKKNKRFLMFSGVIETNLRSKMG